MAVDLTTAISKVELAARDIFGADDAVRSVGVGEVAGGYGFLAIRNVNAPTAFGLRSRNALTQFEGIPVTYSSSGMDPRPLARVPYSGPGSPAVSSVIPERQAQSDMRCGLQIQNYDYNVRASIIARGYIWLGTLGCFVKLDGGEIAILSNNHVLAGENLGKPGIDLISQPGDLTLVGHIATLTKFFPLDFSAAGASYANGKAVINDIDAAVATLEAGVNYSQEFLASRSAVAPKGIATAMPGDRVHKVGRTTGLTFGTVKTVANVNVFNYETGPCWFRGTILINGKDGTTFADHGDSGSAIVRDDGMVVGLLFGGTASETYACPIDKVLQELNCQLA